jgi:hypothetical protein
VLLLLMIAACFLPPLAANVQGPNAGALRQARMPPLSTGHLLGTDDLAVEGVVVCMAVAVVLANLLTDLPIPCWTRG